MDILTILLLAISLSMDSFAVAISQGMKLGKHKFIPALQIGLVFGLVQAGMPFLGFLIGKTLSSFISSFDHWVAFLLLAAIGIKMIHEAMQDDQKEEKKITLPTIFMLAIATSIDALVVGVTFGVLQANLLVTLIVIGVVTAAAAFCGTLLGNTVGKLFNKKFEMVGGLILIGIGLKILIESI